MSLCKSHVSFLYNSKLKILPGRPVTQSLFNSKLKMLLCRFLPQNDLILSARDCVPDKTALKTGNTGAYRRGIPSRAGTPARGKARHPAIIPNGEPFTFLRLIFGQGLLKTEIPFTCVPYESGYRFRPRSPQPCFPSEAALSDEYARRPRP